eukprot:Nk52_evm10s2356 gene=Nk52_evmTU10s2356
MLRTLTRRAYFTTTSSRLLSARCMSSLTPVRVETDTSEVHRNRVDNVKLVDSTLREGEQFSTAFFDTQQKLHIARVLDDIGVDFIEVTTPLASAQSKKDCQLISSLPGLRAKILTHTRCHMDDVRAAMDCGVHGVNVYMATSDILRQHSHGKGIDSIIETASEVVNFVKSHGVQIRFSCEDTFRSDPTDVLKIYSAMEKLGVDRVGMADTVGIATPLQVYETVARVRSHIDTDIEFHTHNDTGCAVANSLIATQAGATHIDTCVLGIGERNGITPLGTFLGRLYTLNKDAICSKYDISLIAELERFVAECVQVSVPFNNCITGSAAFTHKAGVHAKAMLKNADSYEVIRPEDFGVHRTIQIAHRLTGWNVVQQRCRELGLALSDQDIKSATLYIKNLADTKALGTSDVDGILNSYVNVPKLSNSPACAL